MVSKNGEHDQTMVVVEAWLPKGAVPEVPTGENSVTFDVNVDDYRLHCAWRDKDSSRLSTATFLYRDLVLVTAEGNPNRTPFRAKMVRLAQIARDDAIDTSTRQNAAILLGELQNIQERADQLLGEFDSRLGP